jgi:hypothetical protein
MVRCLLLVFLDVLLKEYLEFGKVGGIYWITCRIFLMINKYKLWWHLWLFTTSLGVMQWKILSSSHIYDADEDLLTESMENEEGQEESNWVPTIWWWWGFAIYWKHREWGRTRRVKQATILLETSNENAINIELLTVLLRYYYIAYDPLMGLFSTLCL